VTPSDFRKDFSIEKTRMMGLPYALESTTIR